MTEGVKAPMVVVAKKPAHRPSALTPQVQATIIEALRDGVTRDSAAYLAGISYQTLKLWMRRGRKGEEPYLTFLTVALTAEAEAEQLCSKTVMRAAKSGDVHAAIQFLSRRRKKWSDKQKVEQKIHLGVSNLSDRQLDERIARLERAEAAFAGGTRQTKGEEPEE
jgi:hypothetical protein